MFSSRSALPRFAKRALVSFHRFASATPPTCSICCPTVSRDNSSPTATVYHHTSLGQGQQQRQFGTSPAGLGEGMKLLTHNMLACHIKGVTNNFPLKIEATKVRRE